MLVNLKSLTSTFGKQNIREKIWKQGKLKISKKCCFFSQLLTDTFYLIYTSCVLSTLFSPFSRSILNIKK